MDFVLPKENKQTSLRWMKSGNLFIYNSIASHRMIGIVTTVNERGRVYISLKSGVEITHLTNDTKVNEVKISEDIKLKRV